MHHARSAEPGAIERIDPLGARTSYAYDARGQVTAITGPDGSAERFVYDARGNLGGPTLLDGLGDQARSGAWQRRRVDDDRVGGGGRAHPHRGGRPGPRGGARARGRLCDPQHAGRWRAAGGHHGRGRRGPAAARASVCLERGRATFDPSLWPGPHLR
uniref:RHS repeat domain-containing protein n=1 Tax=Sorangium atrum TaxID=2995308 RepID=UPI00358DAA54